MGLCVYASMCLWLVAVRGVTWPVAVRGVTYLVRLELKRLRSERQRLRTHMGRCRRDEELC